MSFQDVKKALDLAGVAMTGFEILSKLTKNPIDDAAAAVIASVIESVSRGAKGAMSIEAVELELGRLNDQLAAHDAEADRRADARVRAARGETTHDD